MTNLTSYCKRHVKRLRVIFTRLLDFYLCPLFNCYQFELPDKSTGLSFFSREVRRRLERFPTVPGTAKPVKSKLQ
jgi:hypothetical protein